MPKLIATAAFGLEAVVNRELERLGYPDRTVEDGRVRFAADRAAMARANLWLRAADRVLVELGRFEASEFGRLFDEVVALPWEEWVDRDAVIPVEVRAAASPITSPRSAQSIVKKAIVTRLGDVHSIKRLPETGPTCLVDVAIRRSDVVVAIDTSGAGLHKRGYRTGRAAAPLKETLAAGMLELSFWNRDRPLADPFCGSGTLPIEAAMMAANIAPGLRRRFAAEDWKLLDREIWRAAREEARDLIDSRPAELIRGSDRDERVLSEARKHARRAGVGERIHFQAGSFRDFSSSKEYGCLVANPPYGERLGDLQEVEKIYGEIPEVMRRLPTWSFYFLTSHGRLGEFARRRPDRRRKLYNGRIRCTYFQFYGPRPPRKRIRDGVDGLVGRTDDINKRE